MLHRHERKREQGRGSSQECSVSPRPRGRKLWWVRLDALTPLGTAPGSWREAQAVMPQTLSSFLALGILSVWWCFQTAWLVLMLRTRASVTQCFLSRVLSTFIYEWVSSQSLFIAPQPPGAYPFGHGGRLSALWGGRARDSVTCKVLQGSGKTLKEKISQAVLQKMS